jgi:hypothetical protein
MLCRGGGIGRRSGFKIRRQQCLGGSSPPLGTTIRKQHTKYKRYILYIGTIQGLIYLFRVLKRAAPPQTSFRDTGITKVEMAERLEVNEK